MNQGWVWLWWYVVLGSMVTVSWVREPAAASEYVADDENYAASLPVEDCGTNILSLQRTADGTLWIGTEGNGLWRIAPDRRHVSQFTTADGLGDMDIRAICADAAGRLWVGHQHSGVSVYDGTTWKNYSICAGALGEQVTAIARSPADGDMWIATNAGLTRFHGQDERWRDYQVDEAVPTTVVTAMAFSATGMLYLATQEDGIYFGSAVDDYATWRHVSGPMRDALPAHSHGAGLPTNQINDILVMKSGQVVAATSFGLAMSGDAGVSWTYARGRDWVERLRLSAKGVPARWQAEAMDIDLPGDYLTCVREDASGRLWLGFREYGYRVLDLKTRRVDDSDYRDSGARSDFVRAILLTAGVRPLVGWYGNGLTQGSSAIPGDAGHPVPQQVPASSAKIGPPKPRSAPSHQELLAAIRTVAAGYESANRGSRVMTMPTDWRTKGDWIGRYAQWWGRLRAMNSPGDLVWEPQAQVIPCYAVSGPHRLQSDGIRYWIQWLYTDLPDVLELPPLDLGEALNDHKTTPDKVRRESEENDNGEVHPLAWEGPDVYENITVPDGLWQVSLYDFNKDGHDGSNRFRDFTLRVFEHPPRLSPANHALDFAALANQPELAHARLNDFSGGGYWRFAVRGPVDLTIKVQKNYSFNVMVSAVFVDPIDDRLPPYYRTPDEWQADVAKRDAIRAGAIADASAALNSPAPAQGDAVLEDKLVDSIDRLKLVDVRQWLLNRRGIYALLERAYRARADADPSNQAVHRQLAKIYWNLDCFAQQEHELGILGIQSARQLSMRLINGNGPRLTSPEAYVRLSEMLHWKHPLEPTPPVEAQPAAAFDPVATTPRCPGFAWVSYAGPATQKGLDDLIGKGLDRAMWSEPFTVAAWIDKPVNLVNAHDQVDVVIEHSYRDGISFPIKKVMGDAALVEVAAVDGALSVIHYFRVDAAQREEIISRERLAMPEIARLRAVVGIHERITWFASHAAQWLFPSMLLVADVRCLDCAQLPNTDRLQLFNGLLSLYADPHAASDIRSEISRQMDECINSGLPAGQDPDARAFDVFVPFVDGINATNGMSVEQAREFLNELSYHAFAIRKSTGQISRLMILDAMLTRLLSVLPTDSQDGSNLRRHMHAMQRDISESIP